ncbi:MAG: daunorubicin ketoreductase [Microbacteriaceae bacterium]|nr:daunorubicin ketoreductase [Microbacteriaceae bacterium]
MSRILITGSTDGLGLAAARQLLEDGHQVIAHARNHVRADEVLTTLPRLSTVAIGDATLLEDVRSISRQVNDAGGVDAIIHNVGVGYREPRRIETIDGHAHVFQINVLAPYLLTALIPAQRLVWLSSGLHRQGDASTTDYDWTTRQWNGYQAYCDSKLFDATLAMALARTRPDIASNALEPGWVATKMGGASAPDDLALAHVTQVWLAEASDPKAGGTGGYYFHQKSATTQPAIHDIRFQDELVDLCAQLTGSRL